MASPKYQDFVLYNMTTGALVTGQTIGPGGIHFETYKDETGADLAQPTIVELGGGHYGFEPTFVTNHNILYTIACGSGVMPVRVSGFIRPEDYLLDTLDTATIVAKLDTLLDHAEGKWQIFLSGPDANRLVLYKRNGDVLVKFDLKDKYGTATPTNPYAKVPVP